MKKLAGLLSALLLTFGSVGQSTAAVIDFEGTGLSEGASLTTQISGLTFIDAIIAAPGKPLTAFGMNDFSAQDTALPGQNFSGFFITDPIVGGRVDVSGTIQVLFANPVAELSFYVADLDAGLTGGDIEVLTAQAFDNNNTFLETVTISGNSTGDGIVSLVSFGAGNISKLSITAADELGRASWGVDNLSFQTMNMPPSSIPVPGAILLLGSGFVAFLGMKKRFTK